MQSLILLPLGAALPDTPKSLVELPDPTNSAAPKIYTLTLNDVGQLAATSADAPSTDAEAPSLPIATVYGKRSSAHVVWYVLARHPALAVNGVSLPLMSATPGALMTWGMGHGAWWLANRWTPTAVDLPPELAEKGRCGVCGELLSAAPVVRCSCGELRHLQDPTDDDALNCFLAGPCGGCGQQPSLEPRIVPTPPQWWLCESTGEEVTT